MSPGRVLRRLYDPWYASARHALYRVNRRVPILKTPLYVHWVATYECNLHCRHCEAGAGDKGPPPIDTETMARAVTDMGRMGVRTLVVTGGEPLLRDDIFSVIGLARLCGVKKVYLATNGGPVTRRAAEIRRAGLDRVYVNLDGLEPAHNALRGGPAAYKQALEALRFFKDIGVGERVVNSVIHPGNLDDIEALEESVRAAGATQWNIQTAVPLGRAKGMPGFELDPGRVVRLLEFLDGARRRISLRIAEPPGYLGSWDRRLRPRPFYCGAGEEACSIMPDGEVLGCHVVYDSAYSAGNIGRESFASIWKRSRGRFKSPPAHSECRACPSRRSCRGGCWAMRQGARPCLLPPGRPGAR